MNQSNCTRLVAVMPLLALSFGCAMDANEFGESEPMMVSDGEADSVEQPLLSAGVDLQAASNTYSGDLSNTEPTILPDFSVERIATGDCRRVPVVFNLFPPIQPSVAVTIKNRGTVRGRVRIDFSIEESSLPAANASRWSPMLESGETSTTLFYLPGGAPNDVVEHVDVLLDPDNEVREASETNNHKSTMVKMSECPENLDIDIEP